MHRIPLRLKHPSIVWDRTQPEHTLFERTLNEDNVSEMVNFMNIISLESHEYLNSLSDWSDVQLQAMQDLVLKRDLQCHIKALEIAVSVIMRAPVLSPAYAMALKLRGESFFQSYRFEDTASDLVLFLSLQNKDTTVEEYCKVSGILAVCYYLMGQYESARKYIKQFKRSKEKLPANIFTHSNFGKIEAHILQFAPEMNNIENIVPNYRREISFNIPYMGFNSGSHIPLCSSACFYSDGTVGNKKPGVYVICAVPKNKIVLVEDPISQTINTPYTQCEVCFKQSDCIYTCSECHYKTYCSTKCMSSDKLMHQHECLGYKELIIMIMDASSLFRIFIRTCEILHNSVFSHKAFRKNVNTASDVLEKIIWVIRETKREAKQYLNFLVNRPEYDKLHDMQYSTLIATAFRLTVFIEMDTNIMKTFFHRLNISNKQKMILIGSILMRLNCHLLNNTIDFQYKYQLDLKPPQYTTVPDLVRSLSGNVNIVRDSVVEDGNAFYNVNVENDIVARYKEIIEKNRPNMVQASGLPQPSHSVVCGRIQRIMSTFKDNLIELFYSPEASEFFMLGETADMDTTKTSAKIISARIYEMDTTERCHFVQRFAKMFHQNFAQYFLQRNRINNRVEQILSLLCTTVSKMNHSCAPNVEIIVLENGFVLGKTLRDLEQGEELFVSYKAHYMRNTRWERKQFFDKLQMKCNCEHCSKPESKEAMNMRQGILCECSSYVVITPSDRKCWQCSTSYNNLVLKYRTEIKILADVVNEKKCSPNVDDQELYTSYMMLYMHSSRYFVPSNEFRIRVQLEVAKYLSLKNFSKQSYDILMSIKYALATYEERFLIFTFYHEILTIIKILLYYNLDEKLMSISIQCLKDLCKFGLYIVELQKNHLIFYELYNVESGTIVKDYRSLLAWKENILINDILPLADSLRKLKLRQNNKTQKSNSFALMPPLAKLK